MKFTELNFNKTEQIEQKNKFFGFLRTFKCNFSFFCDKTENLISKFFSRRFTALLLAGFVFFLYYVFIKQSSFNLLSVTSHIRECTYQFYLCDYSVGFCSRLLIGAVLSLFSDKISLLTITYIANISIIICIILQSLLTGIILRRALEQKDRIMVIICFLFILNPLTASENTPLNGSLDPYIIILFLIWLFFADTSLAALAAPLISLVCITIHYEAVFTFLPPILAILLYKTCCTETKKSRIINGCSFFTTTLSSAGLSVYFVFFANNHLKLTSDEFYELMASKFQISQTTRAFLEKIYDGKIVYKPYFDYYIFGDYEGENYLVNTTDFFEFLFNYRKNSSLYVVNTCKIFLSFVLPLLILFAALWIICIIKEKGIRKLPYIAFIGIMSVLIPTLLLSTDAWRFTSAVLISQFAILFLLYRDKNSFLYKLFKSRFLNNRITAFAFLLLCIPYICWAYSLEAQMLTF